MLSSPGTLVHAVAGEGCFIAGRLLLCIARRAMRCARLVAGEVRPTAGGGRLCVQVLLLPLLPW